MVPEKLDRVTSAIDDSKSEYEQLLKLMPIYTIVSKHLQYNSELTALHVCLCTFLMSNK